MLHFELSYYTPLEWAIANGIARFEGGAQGEHKMARGFEPIRTYSSHWLADGDFRVAVDRFLQREGMGMAHYRSELEERLPFKTSP
jgi:predicted N-acyltransferase